jgi:hemerythrin-like domain-containing protein
MKQQNGVQPLIRQHQHALEACALLKKGVKKKADLTILQAFTRKFWQNDLQYHIADEERRLIPFLMADNLLKPYARILHNDHQFIERIFERSQDGFLSYRLLELFAENIEQHLRFEENVVFEAMQEKRPGEDCKGLFFDDGESGDPASYTMTY